jgi:hypothetical protein
VKEGRQIGRFACGANFFVGLGQEKSIADGLFEKTQYKTKIANMHAAIKKAAAAKAK